MTEETKEEIMNHTSTICLTAAPLLLGMQMQQQLMQNAQEMGRTMCRLNPFLRPFVR